MSLISLEGPPLEMEGRVQGGPEYLATLPHRRGDSFSCAAHSNSSSEHRVLSI